MLERSDPKPLEILVNERDILRDLFVYLDYFGSRSVKRMTRSNEIPRSDLTRLAKMLDIALPEKEEWVYGRPDWISFIDKLALGLGLVSYDTKGEYRGQSSQEPSFNDNYILVNEPRLRMFYDLTPVEQENKILDALNRAKTSNRFDNNQFNEFFHSGPIGVLDTFERWGSGTGLMPLLNFHEIRVFLLKWLSAYPCGQWFSTQSLIADLKARQPYFLIPQNFPKADRWKNPIGRYDNFRETGLQGSNSATVPPDAVDAFERVEGRYIERFLEYIPLIMRFVDLAYDPHEYSGLRPTMGVLKAFRINERFRRLMQNETAQPKVTVQPNFDIVVAADFYPAKLVREVAAYSEQVSSPTGGHGAYVGIFQLNKSSVASAMVRQPDLDVIARLKEMTGGELPPNVQVELEEWSGHADQFILYENFGLLETSSLPAEAVSLVAERISPGLSLVRSPGDVFAVLEQAGCVPLPIRHAGQRLTLLPRSAASIFPREPDVPLAPKQARPVRVNRVVTVRYQFPDEESFAAMQKMLVELRCPFMTDIKARAITIQQPDQSKFDQAAVKIAGEYMLEVE